MNYTVYCKYVDDSILYVIGTYTDATEAIKMQKELYRKSDVERVEIH